MISTERIEEIIAGTEGVTPGPWLVHSGSYEGSDYRYVTDGKSNIADEVDVTDASHIARLDPDTIRDAFTELLDARAKLQSATEALERTTGSSEAFVAQFNPHNLAEGLAQQREATIEQNRRARTTIALLKGTSE